MCTTRINSVKVASPSLGFQQVDSVKTTRRCWRSVNTWSRGVSMNMFCKKLTDFKEQPQISHRLQFPLVNWCSMKWTLSWLHWPYTILHAHKCQASPNLISGNPDMPWPCNRGWSSKQHAQQPKNTCLTAVEHCKTRCFVVAGPHKRQIVETQQCNNAHAQLRGTNHSIVFWPHMADRSNFKMAQSVYINTNYICE